MTEVHRQESTFGGAIRRMHEWPLVAFTGLAIPAGGVFAARLVTGLPGGAEPSGGIARLLATVALLVALGASLVHLGRPLRSPLALRRAGRSPLSAETLLAVGLLLAALVAGWPGLPAHLLIVADAAAGVMALALLATLGLVYFLPARWPWHSTLVVAPLATGLAVGATALTATAEIGGTFTGLVALLVDGLIFATAWSVRGRSARGFGAVYPAIFARRRTLVAARLILVNAAPGLLLACGLSVPALLAILPGVLVDRLTFYGVAAARSTEAEIARVESTL